MTEKFNARPKREREYLIESFKNTTPDMFDRVDNLEILKDYRDWYLESHREQEDFSLLGKLDRRIRQLREAQMPKVDTSSLCKELPESVLRLLGAI